MPTYKRFGSAGACALSLVLCSCAREADNQQLAQVEAQQVREAAQSGRIFCALAGATAFRMDCTLDRLASSEGTVLLLGRADVGYRRFRITRDGSGVAVADGAEQAQISIIDNGLIEIAVADDRYRLPATMRE